MSTKTPTHAIVIGGSIAGLLAARVLTDHFDRVTIVERDRLPYGDEFRRSIPQARHVHVLHRRGQSILEKYFPGFENEFAAAGVPYLDQGWDMLWHFKTGYAPRVRTGIAVFSSSRTFLEGSLRRRIMNSRRIDVMAGCDVTGLLTDTKRKRATGVEYHRSETPDETEYLLGDMVLVADGRSSRLPDWLEKIGYDRPETQVVNPHLGYASRWYAIPPDYHAHEWQGILLQTTPPRNGRGAILMPVEGRRWVVTLMGTNGDYPPTDEADFLAFAQSLSTPVIYDIVRKAEPVSSIYGYRATENRWTHYHRLSRWPENLMVMGDAFCTLNPSYGQGITIAAVSAAQLDIHLRQRQPGDELLTNAHQFHKDLAGALAQSWRLAAGQDVRWPNAEGGTRGLSTRLMHLFTDQIIRQIPHNPRLYHIFLEIMHGLNTPSALLQPRILLSILLGAFTPKPRNRTVREFVQPTV